MKNNGITYIVVYPKEPSKHISLHKYVYTNYLEERMCGMHSYVVVPKVYEPFVKAVDEYPKSLRQKDLELLFNVIRERWCEHVIEQKQ